MASLNLSSSTAETLVKLYLALHPDELQDPVEQANDIACFARDVYNDMDEDNENNQDIEDGSAGEKVSLWENNKDTLAELVVQVLLMVHMSPFTLEELIKHDCVNEVELHNAQHQDEESE